MAFKIKSTVVNAGQNWKMKDKLYRNYLTKFNKNNNKDLWRYFYWDFFHDGTIEKISFCNSPGHIVLNIDCPNIKRKKKEGFEFVSVNFKCFFRDVVYFRYDHPEPKDLWAKWQYFLFMGSEINTLKDIIKKKNAHAKTNKYNNKFHSLIIEAMGNSSLFYIEMVFGQVDVVAEKPAVFQKMLASDQFEVPIYEKGKER